MAAKKAAKKAAKSASTKKPVTEVKAPVAVQSVEQEPIVQEQIVGDDQRSSEERILLGNEVLASVNDCLSNMAKRGVPPALIESAFYLAFQFAFCDFLRVTGFAFKDAIADLHDMYMRENEAQPQAVRPS